MLKGRLTLQVPATSGNLGPGFDCLGMALEVFNRVHVEEGEQLYISIQGEGEGNIPQGSDNLVYRAMQALFEREGRVVPPVRITLENRIPLARGLGSSAAAVAGGLLAANHLCAQPFSLVELIEMGSRLEGHPDNIVPAFLGGCAVVVSGGEHLTYAQIPLPKGLKAVLFIPDQELKTEEARRVLPEQVSRADAVYNLGRAALLATALASGELEYLRVATQDRLHQPWRQALLPYMPRLFEAALEAGALGVFLSGAGPSVLALTRGKEALVAQAMTEAARGVGLEGRAEATQPSLQGARILEGQG